MSDNHRASYRALVAALREEFSPVQIESLKIQLEDARYRLDSIGVLRQAIGDAWDVEYDAPPARVEYGWAPDGDASDVRTSAANDPDERERWVRLMASARGGSVFVRDVTEWRQEP